MSTNDDGLGPDPVSEVDAEHPADELPTIPPPPRTVAGLRWAEGHGPDLRRPGGPERMSPEWLEPLPGVRRRVVEGDEFDAWRQPASWTQPVAVGSERPYPSGPDRYLGAGEYESVGYPGDHEGADLYPAVDGEFEGTGDQGPVAPSRRRGLVLAIVALVALLVAAAAYGGYRLLAPTAPAQPPGPAAPAGVGLIDGWLTSTSAIRPKVSAAVSGACSLSTMARQSAIVTVAQSAALHGQIVADLKADQAQIDGLSPGSSLFSALESAMADSEQADADYANWLTDLQSTGCHSSPVDLSYLQASQASANASSAKLSFANLWAPVAHRYGAPAWSAAQF